jgi:hypothetical protein
MMRAKTFKGVVMLACSVFILASLAASADDKKDKSALSGVWVLKAGETKIEFSEQNVVKIFPHGDNNVIVVICDYTAEKKGQVKAKITGFDGRDEVKEAVQQMLPIGTVFSFKWEVKDDTAKLDDVKGDNVEPLKAHLEGEYSPKK